jgi:hypothetical protein
MTVFINHRLFFGKFIRSSYLKKENDKIIKLKKQNFIDNFPTLNKICRRKNKNLCLYEAGYRSIEKELSIVRLISTVKKLKAGMAAVI